MGLKEPLRLPFSKIKYGKVPARPWIMMDVATLKETLEKNICESRFKKERFELGDEDQRLQSTTRLQAGRDRSRVCRRASKRPAGSELRTRIKELASERRRFSYPLPARALRSNVPREATAHLAEARRLEEAEPAVPRRRLASRKRGGRKHTVRTRPPLAIPQGQTSGGHSTSYRTPWKTGVGSGC